jgi:hypothetical protein
MAARHWALACLAIHSKTWSTKSQGYRALLDTQVSLRSSRTKCSSVVQHMAWLLSMWSREMLKFQTLSESCALLNLLPTKCSGYKMLQSSSPTMCSHSQMSEEYCCTRLPNTTKVIVHSRKHYEYIIQPPYQMYWAHVPMQQAKNLKCTQSYLHIKWS